MGDELLKLLKLPFVLFGWVIRSLVTVFIVLLVIVVTLAWKDKIAEKVHQVFVDSSAYNGPVITQRTITTHHNIDYILHSFQYGDTIAKLAKRYNVTVNAILFLNDINRNNPVYYGKILYIPQYKEEPYTVQAKRNTKNEITFL